MMNVTVDAVLTVTPENHEDLDSLFLILKKRFVDGETVTKESSTVKVTFNKKEQVK